MSGILIWGAGGHGKVVLDIVRAALPDAHVAFYDDDPKSREICGLPAYSGRESWNRMVELGFRRYVVAIGDNRIREVCFGFAARVLQAVPLIHPSAVVSPSARIGAGTVVMPRAVINAGAVVGPNSIVNTGAIVEHDCWVGAHVHLSPGSVLGGQSVVENLAQVGIHATVLPGIRVSRGALVGAGAVAVRDVPPETIVTGVPARPLERKAS